MKFPESLIDRFVPEPLHNSLDELYRSRILVMVSICSTGTLLPFCIARAYYQGFHPYPIILSLISLLCLTTPLVLRRFKSIELAGIYLTLPGTIAFAGLCLVDGGIDSATIIALPILPLFGIFFSGFGLGALLLGINTVVLLSLAIFPDAPWIGTNNFDESMENFFWAGSGIAASLLLVSMAYFFVQWQQLVRERLMAVNKAKDEFLSGMSHEIRTPLNSIVGFADVLKHNYHGELNEKQTKYVDYILSGSEHLSSLVDDFLDLTNIEEDRVELNRTEFDLRHLVKDCVVSLNNTHENQITLSINDKVGNVVADKTRLKQIILNLLSNAQKFTPSNGSIRLLVNQNNDSIIIAVEDSGPGIPPKYHDDIFSKFFQVNVSLAQKTKGSGLGLFISKKLCDLHGGTLLLDKNYVNGARFVFSVPTSPTTT